MGGCCCGFFSSRSSEPSRSPTYYYCPRTSEERQPLSAHHDGPSGSSAGLLVDTNLDTTDPDTYTAPPPPIPYDVDSGHSQSSPQPGGAVAKGDTAAGRADGASADVTSTVDYPENSEKEIKCIEQSVLELTPSNDFEDDLKKPIELVFTSIEEDDCPICLEEYTEENPRMLTKCEHHFHLCCILEWMERSDSCPVCDQELVIDEDFNI